jgi:HTH-type transcriptional regulator, sugar sensing transcriptional regulator
MGILSAQMELPELKELGLTKGQIKVYQALLDSGTAGIHTIQEKTGLERRAIYDILNKLIDKGFITYVNEKGSRQYQCTHPKNLQEAAEQKKEILSSLTEKMPQITDLFNFAKPDIRAEVYRGNQAMKALLNEALEYDTYWIGGNSGVETCSEEMRLWFKRWTKRRIENKKFMYDLVDYGTSLEDFKPHDLKKHKKSFYKYCRLPKHLQSPLVLIMFGSKVAQVLWSKQSFAFVLESKEISEAFMKYFKYFWKDSW